MRVVSNMEEIIRRKGIKKKHIANYINISATQFSGWLSMKTYPPADKLFLIAHVLDCKVDDLYSIVEDEKE